LAGPTVGQAFLEGAWWRVRISGPPVDEGSLVHVIGVDGLDLIVEAVQPRPDNSPTQQPT
jgi:membrane protein implicated in regulation of membrane protease activity